MSKSANKTNLKLTRQDKFTSTDSDLRGGKWQSSFVYLTFMYNIKNYCQTHLLQAEPLPPTPSELWQMQWPLAASAGKAGHPLIRKTQRVNAANASMGWSLKTTSKQYNAG